MNRKSKSIRAAFAALLISGLGAGAAFASDTTSQTITYEVSAINELSVSAATASLTVNSATAGSAPNAATNTATSYAITTNETNRKITGAINSAMTSGVTLSVALAAPIQRAMRPSSMARARPWPSKAGASARVI